MEILNVFTNLIENYAPLPTNQKAITAYYNKLKTAVTITLKLKTKKLIEEMPKTLNRVGDK